jgi:tetratricopeptide (TPR) repeat protein
MPRSSTWGAGGGEDSRAAAAQSLFEPFRGGPSAAPPLPVPGGYPGLIPEGFQLMVPGAIGDALGQCLERGPAGWLPSSLNLAEQDELPPPDAQLLAEELRKEGVRLVRSGQAAAAVLVYTEALKHAPEGTLLLLNRGACYTRLGRHGEALVDAQHAARLQPSLARAHWQAALALEAQGRAEEALESHERCVAAARTGGSAQLEEYESRLLALKKQLSGKTQREERVRKVMDDEARMKAQQAAKK